MGERQTAVPPVRFSAVLDGEREKEREEHNMRERIRKISVTLMLALGELVLGILLLVNPMGLASVVIILAGVLMIALGGYHLVRYIRLPREKAAETWNLATGTGLITVGITAIANQHWLVQMFGTLAAVYGIMTTVISFMKLQIAVDALRWKRPYWYLMAISFAVTAILAALLFIQPFAESTVWIFAGIVLLVLAVLDGVYFILGRQHRGSADSKAA